MNQGRIGVGKKSSSGDIFLKPNKWLPKWMWEVRNKQSRLTFYFWVAPLDKHWFYSTNGEYRMGKNHVFLRTLWLLMESVVEKVVLEPIACGR